MRSRSQSLNSIFLIALSACGGSALVETTMTGDGGSTGSTDTGSGDGGSDAGLDASDASMCGMCGCGWTGRYSASFAMQASFCEGANFDAGSDAGITNTDPATCDVDCRAACENRYIPGSPASRPWSGGNDTCERKSPTSVDCIMQLLCGRAPEGLAAVAIEASSDIGAQLARCAWLEAASVEAFEILARELDEHHAPRELVDGARRAAREERMHARVMGSLARAHGASTPAAVASFRATRSLEEIARENVIEGCARETYGALLALHQAKHAADPAVRRAMSAIADDEARHAELAWDVAAWSASKLGAHESDRLRQAWREAWDELEESLRHEPPPALARQVGLPCAADAVAMARALRDGLARSQSFRAGTS